MCPEKFPAKTADCNQSTPVSVFLTTGNGQFLFDIYWLTRVRCPDKWRPFLRRNENKDAEKKRKRKTGFGNGLIRELQWGRSVRRLCVCDAQNGHCVSSPQSLCEAQDSADVSTVNGL